jgi:hypothetical protein
VTRADARTDEPAGHPETPGTETTPAPPAREPTDTRRPAPVEAPSREESGPASEAPPPPSAAPEQAEVLPRLLKIAGAGVAPTTLLTGLLFYFGRLHITGFFRYFRVNFTVLDLTPNDYLIRSADGLFRPLAAVTVFGLCSLWLNRLLVERLAAGNGTRILRLLIPALVALGGLLVGVAVADLLAEGPLIAGYPEAGGLGLAGGVLLLAYATHLSRTWWAGTGARARVAETTVLAEWGLAFLLLSIGLFWAVGSYAIAVGTGRAEQFHAGLPNEPDAVVYSERSLRLAVAGVTEVRCADPEAAYRFRYDGLKLVLQAGDQYLLVSADWSRENGTAVLIPRNDAVRLEFAPPGQQRSTIC